MLLSLLSSGLPDPGGRGFEKHLSVGWSSALPLWNLVLACQSSMGTESSSHSVVSRYHWSSRSTREHLKNKCLFSITCRAPAYNGQMVRGEAKEFEFVKAPPVAEDQQVGEPLLCSHPLLFLVRKAELGKVILGEHKLPFSPLKSPAEWKGSVGNHFCHYLDFIINILEIFFWLFFVLQSTS